jgi:transposase InsO family protein
MKKTRYTEEQIAFSLKQAKTGMRVENQYRPHSSLNNQTPEEFIRSLQTGPDL